MPKIDLEITMKVRIDTDDLDPDQVVDAYRDVRDVAEDDEIEPNNIEKEAWLDIINSMLQNDSETVVDLDGEVSYSDFKSVTLVKE